MQARMPTVLRDKEAQEAFFSLGKSPNKFFITVFKHGKTNNGNYTLDGYRIIIA
jgi:hypothetical protein